MKDSRLENLAPSHQNVPFLMKDLFSYLKNSDEIDLIKSFVLILSKKVCFIPKWNLFILFWTEMAE